ncbi:MAG: tripartite tricarboxylate transporter substrate binding protein [Betaproteobacteria bacterium]|nr:tripartite tricarboxylate transporter substrate binding protein [Betaproteobacteria bacterium]
MTRTMRLCAACLAAALLAAPALAQNYPNKPIRWIVPFPPGGSADVMSRTLGAKIAETIGQPVVVENRAGAGGVIGLDFVVKSAPDGYTVALGAPGALTVNVHLTKLPFDPLRDLQPIARLAVVPVVFAAGVGQPMTNIAELIAFARANPGKLSFGTTGTGSVQHLAGEFFKSLTSIDMVHVPYKGSGPAAVDLAGGQLPLAVIDLTSALPHQRSGKIRILGVTGAQRTISAPELPTVAEQGFPGFDASGWFGLLGPAGLPAEVVARLNAEIVRALQAPDVRERVLAAGVEPNPGSADEFNRAMRAEHAKWGKLIRDAGIKSQ